MSEHNHDIAERTDCTEVTLPDGRVIGVCVLTSEDGDPLCVGLAPEESERREAQRAEEHAAWTARVLRDDEKERARVADAMARADAEAVLINHLMSVATIRTLIDEQADCSCKRDTDPSLEQLVTAARDLGLLSEHDLIDLVVYAMKQGASA